MNECFRLGASCHEYMSIALTEAIRPQPLEMQRVTDTRETPSPLHLTKVSLSQHNSAESSYKLHGFVI